MIAPCQLCGTFSTTGMRYAKVRACFVCIDKVLDFAVSAGMRFETVVSKDE